MVKRGAHARQSIDAGAQNAQAIVTGGGASGAQLTWRPAAGAATEEFMDSAPGPWNDGEYWVNLTRADDEFRGYTSDDGADWQDLLAPDAPMSDPMVVGIARCGVGAMATGPYDGFTVVPRNRTLFPLDVGGRGTAAVAWGEMKSRWANGVGTGSPPCPQTNARLVTRVRLDEEIA